MTTNALLEFDSLPQEVRDFLAVVGNALSGLKALDCAKLFPKLGSTHPDGSFKYEGMLIGCMDPAGNHYFTQIGELVNRAMSEKILLNKLTIVRENQILKSMEGRDLKKMIFSGAARGAGKFSGWIFGVSGWPETIDDNLVTSTLHMVEIIGWNDYCIRNNADQTGLNDALHSVGVTPEKMNDIACEIHEILERSFELTFS